MRLDIQIDPASLKSVRATLESLSGKQLAVATSKALNDTGFHVRRAMQSQIRAAFDRPTNYIVRSPMVQMAKPDKLEVRVAPTYLGGKGIDPQAILQVQEFGGLRALKRSERALLRAGILPPSFITVMPETPYPGSDDGRGNLRGAFASQLISYFQAQGEQGYRANTSKARKSKLADKTRVSFLATRKTLTVVRGVQYFVAFGKLRSGRTSHLAPGIWARTGIHGVDIKPVLMFVRPGEYKPLISMERIADDSAAAEYMERRMRFRIREAAGV